MANWLVCVYILLDTVKTVNRIIQYLVPIYGFCMERQSCSGIGSCGIQTVMTFRAALIGGLGSYQGCNAPYAAILSRVLVRV